VTSRERILVALEHREPDRVPVDLGAWPETGIMAVAYSNFKKYLRMEEGSLRVYDLFQQVAQPEEQVLKRIGADALFLFHEPDRWQPGELTDGTACEVPEYIEFVNRAPFAPKTAADGSKVITGEDGAVLFTMGTDGEYYNLVYRPLAGSIDARDIEDYPWPDPDDPGTGRKIERLAEKAEHLYNNTDFILTLDTGGSAFEIPSWYRGNEQFLMDLALDRKLAETLIDSYMESQMGVFAKTIEAVDRYVHIVEITDDLGMQQSPMISPELYRSLIKPRQKEMCDFIRSKTDAYIYLHSCGSIAEFVPDFIEIGVDILNPIQVSAQGMDTARLKREFGKDLVFWGGGCDTQRVLPFGSPQDVRDEVKRRINDLAPGGGFVFCQVHNIQANIEPRNIAAMYDAVQDFGSY
jgi:uroporphyrinogen decarboxylase